MFRATSMPAAGLSVLAGDILTGDRIVLDFGEPARVVDVTTRQDFVFLTLSDGDREVWTERFHRLVPVELALRPMPRAHVPWRRALPWFGAAVGMALFAAVLHAPTFGGQTVFIVVTWLFGCLALGSAR